MPYKDKGLRYVRLLVKKGLCEIILVRSSIQAVQFLQLVTKDTEIATRSTFCIYEWFMRSYFGRASVSRVFFLLEGGCRSNKPPRQVYSIGQAI